MQMLGIHSIYTATEGEGVHLGIPQIFVRFQGCNIGCVNCDSKETWEFDAKGWSLERVLNIIEEKSNHGERPLRRVSITGGDPLHPKHEKAVLELAQVLKERGYYINIEAAGTRAVHSIFDIVDFISFDYKTPSTGVKTRNQLLLETVKNYSNKLQIKSVVESRHDFDYTYEARQWLTEQGVPMNFHWCLTPCYMPGESFPRERFLMAIQLNESMGSPFRVIGQQHKWLFGPDEKDV